MAATLKQALTGNGSKDARQGQSVRRETMKAAEWGKSYFLCLFLFHRGKSVDHPSRSF
jgi:hypothetical protein